MRMDRRYIVAVLLLLEVQMAQIEITCTILDCSAKYEITAHESITSYQRALHEGII